MTLYVLVFDHVYIFHLVNDRFKAIPVKEFGDHVARMHADRDKCFELEYNVSLTGFQTSLHCVYHHW